MAVMETPHRLARSLRQIITEVQSPSVFVGLGFGFGVVVWMWGVYPLFRWRLQLVPP